jgi:hypothetical protein
MRLPTSVAAVTLMMTPAISTATKMPAGQNAVFSRGFRAPVHQTLPRPYYAYATNLRGPTQTEDDFDRLSASLTSPNVPHWQTSASLFYVRWVIATQSHDRLVYRDALRRCQYLLSAAEEPLFLAPRQVQLDSVGPTIHKTRQSKLRRFDLHPFHA